MRSNGHKVSDDREPEGTVLGRRPIVYVETSVISYLVARRSRDVVVLGRQQATRDWWATATRQWRLVVSEAVIREAGAGDPELARARIASIRDLDVVATSPSAYELAGHLVEVRAIPDNAVEDALHVALAVTNGLDFLVSWNFRHIAGAAARRKIEIACVDAGFEPVSICSPDQLHGDSS